jgi:hypothetical protein
MISTSRIPSSTKPPQATFSRSLPAARTTAIDANRGKVVGTVELGGRPEFAMSDEKGLI